MPKRAKGLSAAKLEKGGYTPGRYGDGGGLYLLVRPNGPRFWIFRYVREGKMREMGLGSAAGNNSVSLADARAKARKLFDAVRDGRDPLADRAADEAAAKAAAQEAEIRGKTFREAAGLYIAANETAWRNAKHRQQWANTLDAYVYPHLGDLPVCDVDTPHVLAALEPIWQAKPETASRVRGRLETVLDYAKARGWRSGENPARWRGHVANMLPVRAKVQRVKHHAALPYMEVAAFMSSLADQTSASAAALRFLILTAARTGEVIAARWGEIDLNAKLWTVPAERMKAGREHRVPLSDAAIGILEAMEPAAKRLDGSVEPTAFVFPGGRKGKGFSNMALLKMLARMKRDDITAHGFRSTFRDWAAERTSYASEVAEMALAHTIGDKVEAAYRRGDLFEKRRKLMESWALFCETPAPAGNVEPIRKAAV